MQQGCFIPFPRSKVESLRLMSQTNLNYATAARLHTSRDSRNAPCHVVPTLLTPNDVLQLRVSEPGTASTVFSPPTSSTRLPCLCIYGLFDFVTQLAVRTVSNTDSKQFRLLKTVSLSRLGARWSNSIVGIEHCDYKKVPKKTI